MSWLLGGLLAVTVALAWLGVAGYVRLREPLDRLHCVTFVNGGCGVALLGASAVADGLSNRTGTILLVLAINLLGGAAGSYAIGRALRLRGSLPELDGA